MSIFGGRQARASASPGNGGAPSMFKAIIDQVPLNVIVCTIPDLKIVYCNTQTRKTLATIEHLLPVKCDEMIGTSIDVFHKNPEHQRRLLADPSNLPHRARIRLGEESLDLLISPLLENGVYGHALLTWSVATGQVRMIDTFETDVQSIAGNLSTSASALQGTAESLVSVAKDTDSEAAMVAAAAEELTATAQEISRRIHDASQLSERASEQARASDGQIDALLAASEQIGQVVNLISQIAGQTSLLALNATIEAARAGEAGKGFAVVAQEVKNLSGQTAKATDAIIDQVNAIQSASRNSADAMRSISEAVGSILQTTTDVAAAVEEQNAATSEVGRNVSRVTSLAGNVNRSASSLLDAATRLKGDAASLERAADTFVTQVRAG